MLCPESGLGRLHEIFKSPIRDQSSRPSVGLVKMARAPKINALISKKHKNKQLRR
jgi:hypothetical protein